MRTPARLGALCIGLLSICGGLIAAPSSQESVAGAGKQGTAETIKRFEYGSYQDVERLFEQLGYTPEKWKAGVREIPKIYFATVSKNWRDTATHELSVLTKKRLFFRALAPIALYANKLVLEDRSRVEKAAPAHAAGRLSGADAEWLAALAVRYGVIESPGRQLDAAAIEELLRRVDGVPISLTLSQAAEESGWGTSRFAAEGNALFGQWSWHDKAIKPDHQRSGKGNYGIAAFDTTLDSVRAYLQNLNTHRAYDDLRARRAELRKQGKAVTGRILAGTLTKYSERGEAYVETLLTIMNSNHLDAADQAYLGEGPVYLMVPVGKTAGP